MQDGVLTRRSLFAAGGLGALAAAGLAGAAAAATTMTATEAANLKVVMDFLATWPDPAFDPDKVMPAYLAADCSVRPIDSAPFIKGLAAVAAAFKAYATHGERFKADIVSSFVKGPIVVTNRVDTQIHGDKDGAKFPVIGVFLVHDGKIKEWTDYVLA